MTPAVVPPAGPVGAKRGQVVMTGLKGNYTMQSAPSVEQKLRFRSFPEAIALCTAEIVSLNEIIDKRFHLSCIK